MVEPARRRIRSVANRGEQILALLSEVGPMSLSQIAQETGLKPHEARYATNAMVADEKAHIHHNEMVLCSDGVERQVAFYAVGPDTTPKSRLDYASTSHLQGLYMAWTARRNAMPNLRGGEPREGDQIES